MDMKVNAVKFDNNLRSTATYTCTVIKYNINIDTDT